MHISPLGNLARTHTAGELTSKDIGKDVVLVGWVHRIRDLGSLVFIDLRDRYGLTQVVVRENDALVEEAKRLRSEFVIAVIGQVFARAAEAVNPKMKTGEIEVEAREIRLLNDAKVTPFPINNEEAVVAEDPQVAPLRGRGIRRSGHLVRINQTAGRFQMQQLRCFLG